MKKKKGKVTGIAAAVVIIAAAAVLFAVHSGRGKGKDSGRIVYVQSLGDIMGQSSAGQNRFMGVVESQETKIVKKDEGKKVKEVYVNVGDIVKKGDKLFSYDTTDMEMNLEQLQLDLQGIQNTISTDKNTLNDLTAQRNASTDPDERASLTSQINQSNASLNEENYNLQQKQLEIKKQQDAMADTGVTSPMDGIIRKVGNTASEGDASDTDAFITIMEEGEFRVKGTVTEQNVHSLTKGSPVIIRSRINEDQIWKGTVTKVDQEPQSSDNSSSYGYGPVSGETTASKYSFYVQPESSDGMMLGQHLYIELDEGQTDAPSGLQIPSFYIFQENGKNYVWKRGKDHRLVKQELSLGDYSSETDAYAVSGGLTEEDYIAFPEPDLQEGDRTTTDYDKATGTDAMSGQEGGVTDDGFMDYGSDGASETDGMTGGEETE